MFALIESCPDSRPGLGWTGKVISLVAHAFLISVAAALSRTAVTRIAEPRIRVDSIVWTAPARASVDAATEPAFLRPGPPRGLVIPTSLSPVIPDLPVPGLDMPAPVGAVPFDNESFNTGLVVKPGATLSEVPLDVNVVEEPPVLVSHPPIRFSEVLRQAGISGHVIVETVIDSLGHAEREFTRVVQEANPLFNAEALDVVMGSQYRPGRMGTRAVRVRVRVPVNFEIR